jgi:DNA-damage-inducible protein D
MQNETNSLAIFENFKIRRYYDKKTEMWYFSVIDVTAALIGQTDFKKAKSYWTTLKNRLKMEGSELVTKCDQLKMQSADGKFYLTDVANVETILRLIQSVPSKKAEPIKLWLAKVGYERMQEMADPEKALNRSREYWLKQGRSQKWIQQRMMGQETRNKLTDYWSDHEVKRGEEFAILTNIIHQEWSDLSVKQHKNLKD